MRRDYESLYSLGIAFAAYAAAESVHGSGFLAAFAAGPTIAFLDVELCDCFREYGETTAELALLLTFVLLGSSLIWSGVAAASGRTLLFAALVLFGRPVIYLAALAADADRLARPAGDCRGSARAASRRSCSCCSRCSRACPKARRSFAWPAWSCCSRSCSTAGTLIWVGRRGPVGNAPELITVAEVQALLAGGQAVLPIDVRKAASWQESDEQARGALRFSPDRPVADARVHGLPLDTWLVLYCT